MKKIITAILPFVFITNIFSQEAIKSIEEEYYDFLSLSGIVERPTLNYRTLSDSEWKFNNDEEGNSLFDSEENVWKNNNLGTKKTLYESDSESTNWFTKGIDKSIKFKIYGPEWYNSYNTAAPYGQNDGGLWQGKGYNTAITAGGRFESFGFELTVKPQLSFSQNKYFEEIKSLNENHGYFWGSGSELNCDAPQRFGDKSFWNFDFGDTEIRYTWYNLTLGFGTQSIWLGPSFINPILHSNNAATYPKVDVGLRKTKIIIPYLDWELGEIEGRLWTGRLKESDYFNEDSSDDYRMFHGISASFSPSFIPGLTIGANRVCLTNWNWDNLSYILISSDNTYVGVPGKGEDQKISVTADFLYPKVGFEVYGEYALDDGTIKWHARAFTIGLKKTINVFERFGFSGLLFAEYTNSEMTQDFQYMWPYNFGFHYQVRQGYTNKGQWLGCGCGYGGNGYTLGFKTYHKKGSISFLYNSTYPDNSYLYGKAVNYTNAPTYYDGKANYINVFAKRYEVFDLESTFFVTKDFYLTGGFAFQKIKNKFYDTKADEKTGKTENNFQFRLSGKYNF